MRLFLLFVVSLNAVVLQAQSFVYKRNPATGGLEVYQSQGGLPTGNPLYKIKKNVYGYLEIENVNTSSNPFTHKPDYSASSNFQSYQLPTKEIFETIEVLNKRNEYDYTIAQPNTENTQFEKDLNNIREILSQRSLVANSFLKFYKSNISFPKTLKDGWYEVVEIFDVSVLYNALNPTAENGYQQGICKVQNNKIVEYYQNCSLYDLKTGFVFQKLKLNAVSPVASCKAIFRASNSNDYTTVFFLDNILDSTKQISAPDFSFYPIYTGQGFYRSQILNVLIARNKAITIDEVRNFSGGQYHAMLSVLNPQTNCNNSLFTLAFKNTGNASDKFSIGILNVSDKKTWIMSNVTLTSGSCTGTVLTTQ